MTPCESIIVSILAATDARFWPQREPESPSWSRFASAAAEVRATGVPWSAGAASDAERRSERDALAALVEARDVLRLSSPGDRTIRVALSDVGEDRARRLCGLPSLRDAYEGLKRLARLQRVSRDAVVHPRSLTFDHRVRRWELASDVEWWAYEELIAETSYERASRERPPCRSLVGVVTRMLPLIERGLVDWNADAAGRVAYRVTESGLAALKSHRCPFDGCREHVAADGEASETYWRELNRVSERIASTSSRDPANIGGATPLPVSMPSRRLLNRMKAESAVAPAK